LNSLSTKAESGNAATAIPGSIPAFGDVITAPADVNAGKVADVISDDSFLASLTGAAIKLTEAAPSLFLVGNTADDASNDESGDENSGKAAV
jgi:hypothetical protein